jgi:hypothetical protein
MPYQTIWVEPERLLEHRGVVVFHIYKNDDFDQGPRRYDFTVNAGCSQCDPHCDGTECRHVFHVHELSTWQAPAHPPYCTGDMDTPDHHTAWDRHWELETQAIRAALIKAIDQGELTPDGVQPVPR